MAEEPSIAKQKWYSGIKTSKRTQFGKRRSMTSYRQIEANRRNALKSTGPKTETRPMDRRKPQERGRRFRAYYDFQNRESDEVEDKARQALFMPIYQSAILDLIAP